MCDDPNCSCCQRSYLEGLQNGYALGYNRGFRRGFNSGFKRGLHVGYGFGYVDGYVDAALELPPAAVSLSSVSYIRYLSRPVYTPVTSSSSDEDSDS